MSIEEKVDILIAQFEQPEKALLAILILLEELPNTLLEEQETYTFWLNVKAQLIKKHFK